jgi:hypothetical protein
MIRPASADALALMQPLLPRNISMPHCFVVAVKIRKIGYLGFCCRLNVGEVIFSKGYFAGQKFDRNAFAKDDHVKTSQWQSVCSKKP